MIRLLQERNRIDREQLEIDRALVEETRQQKRLARIAVKNKQAAYRAEQARYRLLEATIPDYVKLAEQLSGILPLVQLHLEQLPALSSFHEAQEEIHLEIEMMRWLLDKIFILLQLTLSSNGHKRQAEAIKNEVESEQARFSRQRELSQYRRNLRYLMERKAGYGGQAPVSLINEIEATEAEIARLEQSQ